MGKETRSPANESTELTICPRRRKVTNLEVKLTSGFDLAPAIERWERALLLPHLAEWLDEETSSKPIQKESSNGK